MKEYIVNEQYPVYDREIKGLCPNKCSCDVCRNARKSDAGYQEYLSEKWAWEHKREQKRTLENAIAHDGAANNKQWKGHERAVRMFQGGCFKS